VTLELSHPADAQPESSLVSWMSPDRGLWVASRGGEYLGMVERRDNRYFPTDAKGRSVGSYEDFTAAQIAIDHDNLTVDLDRRERIITRITIGLAAFSALGITYALGFMQR